MSTPLTHHVARALDLDAEAARDVLREYGARLRKQAEAGDAVVLPHVGTIAREDGRLVLTPEDDLTKAVRLLHEELEPITLSLPEKAVPESPPVPEAEEPDADAQASPAQEEDTLAFAPTPASESPEALSDAPSAPAAETQDVESAAGTTPSDRDLPPSPRKRHRRAVAEPPRHGRGILIPLLIALAVLIGGAVTVFFLVYEGSVENLPFRIPGVSEEAVTAQSETARSPSDTAAAVLPVDPDPDTTVTAPASADTTEAPAMPPGIDPAEGGWTIIIGAYQARSEADTTLSTFRERLRDAEVPLDVIPADEGTTRFRYRVGVGRFASRQAAVAAQRDLGDRLPEDAWILQLE